MAHFSISLMSKLVTLASQGRHTKAGWPHNAYGASKVGLTVLTRVQQAMLDRERPGEDIVVNSVSPGYVRTEMNGGAGNR